MTDQLTLEIPERTATHLVVATDEHIRPSTPRLRALLVESAGRTPETAGLAHTAIELLETPRLLVGAERATDSDWAERLETLAGRPGAVRRVRAAEHHIVFSSVATPKEQPIQDRAVRLAARLLAADVAGTVADLTANLVLGPGAERGRFVLADDWVAPYVSLDRPGGSMRVETVGMRRFGLPDLALAADEGDQLVVAANVLRALAFRLVSDHWTWLAGSPGLDYQVLSTRQFADSGDLWRFWGARPVGDGGVPVRLEAERAGCTSCLTVLRAVPPADRELTEWWEEVLEVIPPLTAVRPEALRG